MGRPEQRPDNNARRISVWERADECWFDEVYVLMMTPTVIDTGADDDHYFGEIHDYLRSWEERGTIRAKVRDTPVLQLLSSKL